MIRIFMLYEIFYYMVFTRYSAGKIWLSICVKDIVKPELRYQINLTRLNNKNLMKIIYSYI